jgi:hypothetical protein
MKIILYAIFALSLIGFTDTVALADGGNLEHSYVPKSGFVPNEDVAVKIAEAVLFNIYGRAQIEAQKPYQTTDTGEEWIIRGSISPNRVGGTFLIKISKTDGRVMLVTHSK